MTPKAAKWVEAGRILASDPAAKVKCPNCEASDLVVTDVVSEADPTLVERVLECPSCGERNILRLRQPAPTPER